MKLSNIFLNEDEKFLSKMIDDIERKSYLDQLYRYRTTRVFFVCVYVIMAFVGIGVDTAWFLGLWVILLVVQVFSYLDTDSKIRTIRLYELLTKK